MTDKRDQDMMDATVELAQGLGIWMALLVVCLFPCLRGLFVQVVGLLAGLVLLFGAALGRYRKPGRRS